MGSRGWGGMSRIEILRCYAMIRRTVHVLPMLHNRPNNESLTLPPKERNCCLPDHRTRDQ